MDLWFVTALDTEKIDEIRANPKVGVLYYRDADNAYVSLAGTAEISTDKALIKSKWKESWKVWFPDGPDQENLALIKVAPHEAEYWEPKGGKLTVMFEMARGYLTGDHPEINPPVDVKL
jgi:general stress protein 26